MGKKRWLALGLLMLVPLAGCKPKEYITGPSWEVYNVLTSEYQGEDYTVKYPDWGETGRSGDDFYILDRDGDELLSVLFIAKGEPEEPYTAGTLLDEPTADPGAAGTKPQAADDVPEPEPGPGTNDVDLSYTQSALYDLMGTRLDAIMFQHTGLRYAMGTYDSMAATTTLNQLDALCFSGTYGFAEEQTSAERQDYPGYGYCLDTKVGPVLIFGMDLSDNPEEMDKLTHAVKDIAASFQYSAGSGVVENPRAEE